MKFKAGLLTCFFGILIVFLRYGRWLAAGETARDRRYETEVHDGLEF